MGAALAGFLGLSIFKDVTEKPGMHLGNRKLVDLLEILDITKFFIVKRETVETIPLRVNVHRAVIRASKINIFVFPFCDTGNRLTPMVDKSLYEWIFVFFYFV